MLITQVLNSEIVLFHCLVVPSMKTEVASANEGEEATKQNGYTIYLAFNSNGCLLGILFCVADVTMAVVAVCINLQS